MESREVEGQQQPRNKASTNVAQFDCRTLSDTPTVTIVGQSSKCQNLAASPEFNDKSLGILFSGTGCDSSETGANLNVVALAVGLSVAAAVLIAVALLMIIPKTRNAIFPFLRSRKESPQHELDDQ